jgi:hypothetical protein
MRVSSPADEFMLSVSIEKQRLCFGGNLRVSFHRTLRVPEGERDFPLPPSFGNFPIHPVAGKFPVGESGTPVDAPAPAEVVIPLRQSEALWLGFEGVDSKPHAVLIGAGEINVLTGEPQEERLHATPQNYIVCPDQPWLDGINAGDGFVRQFVATPLGSSLSLEEQLGASELTGGIRITVFAPKPDRLQEQKRDVTANTASPAMDFVTGEEALALGAGGKIRQRIYPDPYGLDTWDTNERGSVFVRLLNSSQFRAMTGSDAPPSPIGAATYARHGLDWFELYDEEHGDIRAADPFINLRTVGSGESTDVVEELDPDDLHVRRLRRGTRDGQT